MINHKKYSVVLLVLIIILAIPIYFTALKKTPLIDCGVVVGSSSFSITGSEDQANNKKAEDCFWGNFINGRSATLVLTHSGLDNFLETHFVAVCNWGHCTLSGYEQTSGIGTNSNTQNQFVCKTLENYSDGLSAQHCKYSNYSTETFIPIP